MADRLGIQKTYKLFIGGKFTRTESGRHYSLKSSKNDFEANVCLASRKDLRDAVKAASGAWPAWAARTAYNRAQILYRLAEMMEGRRAQLEQELIREGVKPAQARDEVSRSIDRVVYYSGWCDKYSQCFSTVNPVSGPFFNFSVPEPMGVVGLLLPEKPGLLALLTMISASLAGGNSVVVIASEIAPLTAMTLAECLHTSDVPGGLVNILTGKPQELAPHMADHMDVNAIWWANQNLEKLLQSVQEKSVENMKRLVYRKIDWESDEVESPEWIVAFNEIKTTWHPVEAPHGASSAY